MKSPSRSSRPASPRPHGTIETTALPDGRDTIFSPERARRKGKLASPPTGVLGAPDSEQAVERFRWVATMC